MTDPFKKVSEFVEKFKRPVGLNEENIKLSFNLIGEEYDEVYLEFDKAYNFLESDEGGSLNISVESLDKVALTGELADLIYVCCYAGRVLELPLAEVFEEKHRANLTKLDDNGNPVTRKSDGKVLKGPNYQPPNYERFFK